MDFFCTCSLELKSLEEPRYLLGEFAKQPVACLTLASFLATNTGDVARRHIKVFALLMLFVLRMLSCSDSDSAAFKL